VTRASSLSSEAEAVHIDAKGSISGAVSSSVSSKVGNSQVKMMALDETDMFTVKVAESVGNTDYDGEYTIVIHDDRPYESDLGGGQCTKYLWGKDGKAQQILANKENHWYLETSLGGGSTSIFAESSGENNCNPEGAGWLAGFSTIGTSNRNAKELTVTHSKVTTTTTTTSLEIAGNDASHQQTTATGDEGYYHVNNMTLKDPIPAGIANPDNPDLPNGWAEDYSTGINGVYELETTLNRQRSTGSCLKTWKKLATVADPSFQIFHQGDTNHWIISKINNHDSDAGTWDETRLLWGEVEDHPATCNLTHVTWKAYTGPVGLAIEQMPIVTWSKLQYEEGETFVPQNISITYTETTWAPTTDEPQGLANEKNMCMQMFSTSWIGVTLMLSVSVALAQA
jgi:hypothetical protein